MAHSWVTGARGFIGRHLTRHLAATGDRVSGIGHGAWDSREAHSWGVSQWLNGDVESSNLTELLALGGPPTAIYHLAGGSSVGSSFQAPLEDFHRTVASTASLLDWTRAALPGVTIVAVSSAAVYGPTDQVPIHESAPRRPLSPYGHHKSMMEDICHAYAENFGQAVSIVRLFSVYGPGLQKQLVWDLCRRLDAGESPIRLGGTGEERRDWLHVDDAVRLLALATRVAGRDCPVVNGGTGVATSVREIGRLICDFWGRTPELLFSGEDRRGDPPTLVADCSASTQLGFAPRVPLEDGLRRTVEWHRWQASAGPSIGGAS